VISDGQPEGEDGEEGPDEGEEHGVEAAVVIGEDTGDWERVSYSIEKEGNFEEEEKAYRYDRMRNRR
jgi:hypothetical protein